MSDHLYISRFQFTLKLTLKFLRSLPLSALFVFGATTSGTLLGLWEISVDCAVAAGVTVVLAGVTVGLTGVTVALTRVTEGLSGVHEGLS